MYKKFYLKTMLLLCALIVGYGSAWADTTETLTVSDYAADNSWVDATQYTSAQVGIVSFVATGGSNTGKYYNSDKSWRFYANESAKLTISVPEGNTLVSVKPTFTVKDSGTLLFANSSCTSKELINVSGNSAVFTISQSSGSKGKVYFTAIEVTYKAGGSSDLQESDLALTNASVALNFDLYNNSSDQTISYTTTSTGAVTVSGGDGYVTTSVNATNKTITVTPIAVTPSAQTITVSQAADDTYAAGSATFTVTITNSAPELPNHTCDTISSSRCEGQN